MRRILIMVVILVVLSCDRDQQKSFNRLEGLAFGTSFHISMDDPEGRVSEKVIDSLIHAFNKSLSTYIPNSDISKINRGDTTVVIDDYFKEVFEKSAEIYKQTDGAFDPTIGILVNAWGFGPGASLNHMEPETVDSLMQYVGFDQLHLREGKLIKEHPETYLDFNANAKGFAVDVIGRYLESQGIRNYMVEIGGEVRSRGMNARGELWRIAIEEPNFDGTRSFKTVVSLEDECIATSGNYRKFKIDSVSGEKYAHTMDTKTGYPSKSNLLSASVIGSMDCADVDAYATAFMAMGLERTLTFLNRHPDLKVFLIYSEDNGDLKSYSTDNLALENP